MKGRLVFCGILKGLLAFPLWLSATDRLDRWDLLQVRADDDSVATVQSLDDWQARRHKILAGMQSVMGTLPGNDRRVPLEIRVDEEVSTERYVRRLISYQSEPGSRTPAYHCIPHEAFEPDAQLPAALCLHPTDNRVGHQVVLGLGGRPGRQYAAELLGALAPRPIYVNAPLHDGNFRWQSVARCANAARAVYALSHAEDRLVVRHPDSGHDFPEPLRKQAYRLFDRQLR